MPTAVQRYNQFRGNWKLEFYIEGDSQTFKAGDPVIDSSDKCVIFAAADADLTAAGGEVIGVAMRDGTNTTGITAKTLPVLVPMDKTAQMLLASYAATATDAQHQDLTPNHLCVLRNVGGIPAASIATTSNPVLQLREKTPGWAATEQFTPNWWSFLAAELVVK